MGRPPGWLVGIGAAVAALMILGFDLALFASLGGVVFAAVTAFWIGATAASLADPPASGRNALIVALSIVACVVAYVGFASTRPAPPGTSYGGPNVLPPVSPR
jgi:hypothetical protein